jgi:hypothetical protein
MEKLKIIVSGYIARCPIGGMAWHHVQYLIGLKLLGHEVIFIEDSDDVPWSCYNPISGNTGIDPTQGLEFLHLILQRCGLSAWAYHDSHMNKWLGPCANSILQDCKDADLYLDLSLANPVRPWTSEIKRRAGIGTDPVFNHVRNLTDPEYRRRCAQHDVLFTFAENINEQISNIPNDGFRWEATRQPIVLSCWPVTEVNSNAALTTVMQWDSYSRREWSGIEYGMKSDSFAPFLGLPAKVKTPLELALGSRNAPREQLREHGWNIVDPISHTLDPWDFQNYVQGSLGEFSVAKHGYIVTNSGWFSERSANYLASGRPVITQDTGFSLFLPCGQGLLTFTTLDEAVNAIESVSALPREHGVAARAIASEYFASDRVLKDLIRRIFSD